MLLTRSDHLFLLLVGRVVQFPRSYATEPRHQAGHHRPFECTVRRILITWQQMVAAQVHRRHGGTCLSLATSILEAFIARNQTNKFY